MARAQEAAGVAPANIVEDALFLRRATLDLAGRIPTVAEARVFLADQASDKRLRLVERLIHTREFAKQQAVFWRKSWIPQADVRQFSRLSGDTEDWLAAQLGARRPLNEIARALLTASTSVPDTDGSPQVAPLAFLAASEFKPETLAANSSRAFLGINLDCAQCHDHPFDRWTQEEFWQTAAFFVRPTPAADGAAATDSPIGLATKIPGTATVVSARLPAAFLKGDSIHLPESIDRDTGRLVLAEWMTSPSNTLFARAAANRVWARLMGRGLVEPLDDLSPDNPPSHPELLDELAIGLMKSNFDVAWLTSAIVQSDAYQRSSVTTDSNAVTAGVENVPLFTRQRVRALSADQVLSSLAIATGQPAKASNRGQEYHSEGSSQGLREFRAHFSDRGVAPTDRSIPQALALRNGLLVREWTSPNTSPLVQSLARMPFFTAEERIETMFLATLSRRPEADELAALVPRLEAATSASQDRQALANLLWALVNCHEFQTNH